MDSVEDIVKRMSEACDARNDVELAQYLGLSRSSTISTWKSRNSKPYAYCETIAKQEGVTMDWLLTGREPKYVSAHQNPMDKKEAKLLEMLNSLSDENRREILSRIESMYTSDHQAKRIEELERQINDLYKKIS